MSSIPISCGISMDTAYRWTPYIDGHHKLIRWRLVTHGGIDGCSRWMSLPFFGAHLSACCFFWGSLSPYACTIWPWRGLLNTMVMTHNERIERLWRDVFRCVCLIPLKTSAYWIHWMRLTCFVCISFISRWLTNVWMNLYNHGTNVDRKKPKETKHRTNCTWPTIRVFRLSESSTARYWFKWFKWCQSF